MSLPMKGGMSPESIRFQGHVELGGTWHWGVLIRYLTDWSLMGKESPSVALSSS